MNRTRATILSVTGGLLAAAVVLALLSPGWAGGASAVAGPSLSGCHEVEAKELYVQRAYACDDGTRVLTFADVAARDAYLTAAEAFGQVTVERSSGGAAWARVR